MNYAPSAEVPLRAPDVARMHGQTPSAIGEHAVRAGTRRARRAPSRSSSAARNAQVLLKFRVGTFIDQPRSGIGSLDGTAGALVRTAVRRVPRAARSEARARRSFCVSDFKK
jgi:hypothetical protein